MINFGLNHSLLYLPNHEVKEATSHFGWCVGLIKHTLLCKIRRIFHLPRNYLKTVVSFWKTCYVQMCTPSNFLSNKLSISPAVELGGSEDGHFGNIKMYKNSKVDLL